MLKLASDNTPEQTLARDLKEGQLFLQAGERLAPDNVKMAVCRYSDDDNDVVYIYPFANKRLCEGMGELRNDYVSESCEVQLVNFVGELELVK